jgi:hypothetical protein
MCQNLAASQFSKKCKYFRRSSDYGTTPPGYFPQKARLAVLKAIVIISDDLHLNVSNLYHCDQARSARYVAACGLPDHFERGCDQ